VQRSNLTAVTVGCNLGPTQAARHLQGLATAHELSFTKRRHLSVDQLDAAIKDLINAYHRCDLPRVWGSGSSRVRTSEICAVRRSTTERTTALKTAISTTATRAIAKAVHVQARQKPGGNQEREGRDQGGEHEAPEERP
jgi:hypothetical protein